MSGKMNLIFEPADLEQASPATVSRCGMIYLEPHQLGWRPFKESYMQNELPKTLQPEHIELVNDLFEWLIDPCLDFIRHDCRTIIHSSPSHMVTMLQTLFKCLLDEIAESGEEGKEQMSSQQVCDFDSRFSKLLLSTENFCSRCLSVCGAVTDVNELNKHISSIYHLSLPTNSSFHHVI